MASASVAGNGDLDEKAIRVTDVAHDLAPGLRERFTSTSAVVEAVSVDHPRLKYNANAGIGSLKPQGLVGDCVGQQVDHVERPCIVRPSWQCW